MAGDDVLQAFQFLEYVILNKIYLNKMNDNLKRLCIDCKRRKIAKLRGQTGAHCSYKGVKVEKINTVMRINVKVTFIDSTIQIW